MSLRTRFAGAALAGLSMLLVACDLKPPITVIGRESAVGQGWVLTVTNTSGEDFLRDVVVEITAPSGEVKKYFAATLNPNESVNIGWLKLEGWPIPEGSEVKVSCEGYVTAAGPFTVSAAAGSG